MPATDAAQRKLLKNTISRCPVCHAPAPAGVWKERTDNGNDRIVLSRTCTEHGKSTAVISSDARFYWLSQGSDDNRCGAGCACSADPSGLTGTLGKNAFAEKDATIEQLSTCLALIEIVDSCNLACPTCFADSPVGTHSKLSYHRLPELKKRITAVLERKQHIEILQLSGGEPTLHPDFFELLDWIHEQVGIDYTLINTNGVRLAKDDEFLRQLGERVSRGHLQLYLQFDGPQEAGQRELRGADLRSVKQVAMERCQIIGLPVTLAMTVNEHNLSTLWDTIEWGIGHDNCRGVSFQPMFLSGRSPTTEPQHHLNTADIILGSVEQSAGRLKFDDFTPLPCGDPNCATIGYLLKTPEGIRSISDFIDFAEVQGFLKDKVHYRIEDLAQCGCDNTALGDILKQFEFRERDTFRLFIKPFMDAWTWDEDRIDRCCTHVIRPDGKLDSFCRYYSGFPDCASTEPIATSTLPSAK
ncbi:radical SAM protein [Haloferula sp.]|uniref:radical SAM protein n=1 Tax=Haloferula sp. TaxID=2497595 RepID=UPI0032A14381